MPTEIATHHAALLGLRVVTAMQKRGLNIAQLAHAAHLPLSTVQKIGKGAGKQSSVWTIRAIAVALEVSTDYLVGLTEEET